MTTQFVQSTLWDRVTAAATSVRDWLDERGKAAWLTAMILGFVFVWPVGLGILAYMIWSKRMFGCRHHRHHRNRRDNGIDARAFASTGNAAFDAYRAETLKRLEDEHREFLDFLQKLREARDKAEFDQFMQQRGSED